MRPLSRPDGFTLTELLISTAITLLALGSAVTTFKNAVSVNQTGQQTADANQNLRAGTNLLIRDLLEAGRGLLPGGIPIPSGANSQVINRPSPPGQAYTFDNVTSTTLPAITTGFQLGPIIDAEQTDMITMVMTDPLLGKLNFNTGLANQSTLAADGSNLTIGTTAADVAWLAGLPSQGIPAVAAGDLVWLTDGTANTIQTVTSVDATHAYFANTAVDKFNFNQPGAAAGSITQLLPPTQGNAKRVLMYTYYVDGTTTANTPRLTKVLNFLTPQALAGVVEDLNIGYDLVDGATNPINLNFLPQVIGGIPEGPNLIRKVNLHIGVRSDQKTSMQNDYMRNHLSTVVSIRNLAFTNRYP